MKKTVFTFIIFSCFLSLFSGCKPTEKGYKAAYDAALGKRESALADMDVNLPEGSFQQIDGPQLKEVDGVKVYVLNQVIKPANKDKVLAGPYNVAVGSFKMATNSNALSDALKAEGFDAFSAKETDGTYYAIAGSFQSLSDAVKFYKELEKGNNRTYVGLPKAPVIIYSPR